MTPPEQKADPRSIMPVWLMHAFNVLYSGVPENMLDPLLSPVMAQPEQLTGLPPALFLITGHDTLRFEAQRYAGQLVAAGVDVEVHHFNDCDHGWVVSGGARHNEARATIFDWLNRLFGRTIKGGNG